MYMCETVRVHTCVSVPVALWPPRGLSHMVTCFPISMEVGVCVEAYRQEAEAHRRHINSAFMTFVVLDADDQPQLLPWIRPQPGVSGLMLYSGMAPTGPGEWGDPVLPSGGAQLTTWRVLDCAPGVPVR